DVDGNVDNSRDNDGIDGDKNIVGDGTVLQLVTTLLTFLGGILNGDDTPPPVAQPCNQLTESGGQGTTSTVHQLGVSGPTSFQLQYEMYSIPDQLQVFYE